MSGAGRCLGHRSLSPLRHFRRRPLYLGHRRSPAGACDRRGRRLRCAPFRGCGGPGGHALGLPHPRRTEAPAPRRHPGGHRGQPLDDRPRSQSCPHVVDDALRAPKRPRGHLRSRLLGKCHPQLSGGRPHRRSACPDRGRTLSRAVGLFPEDIRVPVAFWHGTADKNLPWEIARKLAARVPGSTATGSMARATTPCPCAIAARSWIG